MSFALERPGTEAELLRALAAGPPGRVAVLAGGTDLLMDLEAGRLAPARLVSLARLPWRELERRDGRLRIGSLRPLREIEKDPALPDALPGLFDALRAVGSPALRQRATLGGNLGRSAAGSDLLPVLLALGARVELLGAGGTRTVELDGLLDGPRAPSLRPGELIRAIELPARAPCAYAWQRVRPANDVSQVGVAVGRPSASGGWRVALGGVPPVPRRLPEAESELADALPSPARIAAASERAATSAPFRSDRRATEAYRRLVVRVLTARALRAALGGGP